MHLLVISLIVLFAAPTLSQASDQSTVDVSGRFYCVQWSPDRRVRVNSPDTATGPYRNRSEAAATGRLSIPLEIEPSTIESASVYLELWGGHPGTASKGFQVNNGPRMALPEVGVATLNCAYHYPMVQIDPVTLNRGNNIVQFDCVKGESFWGHYIIDHAALILGLDRDHPVIEGSRLSDFRAEIVPNLLNEGETVELRLEVAKQYEDMITEVSYQGYYDGYDENGNGKLLDWHGFTKKKAQTGGIGNAQSPPFRALWDRSMLLDRKEEPILVRAVVQFGDDSGLRFMTPVSTLPRPNREGIEVTYHPAQEFPKPFWSRDSEEKTCVFEVDFDTESILRAELHMTIWDGGRGEVENPVTLNGQPVEIAGNGRHDLLYRVVDLPKSILKQGRNRLRVLSETEHHGIEVLLPGPALIIRRQTSN